MLSALATDLYELAMAAGYDAHDLNGRATFELYVRGLPATRGFLVAAGLDQALAYLEQLRFSAEEIAYLRALPNLAGLDAGFFDTFLPAFRFTGEVWAVAEGTPIFPPAPLLRVTAPLAEAQLVETALLSIVMFQTGVASKAARMVEAAAGRSVIEFGSRRAHGMDAARMAARAAFVAGCDATSNVEAGHRYGIPLSGTMAHAWVTAFATEVDAFRRYADSFTDHAVLLIDTYDTLAAARLIVAEGLRPAAVRLDSGDLGALAVEVRRILDQGGLDETRILASGELDEHRIAELVAAGAPIDGFGVGAAISTGGDVPSLGGVYKLVEVERDGRDVGVAKLSEGKQTWPCRKQVWRCFARAEPRVGGADAGEASGAGRGPGAGPDAGAGARAADAEWPQPRGAGLAVRDVIGLEHEDPPDGGEPLLACVMEGGRRRAPAPPLAEIRARSRAQVARLPPGVRRLTGFEPYPVTLTAALEREGRAVAARATRR